MGQGFSCLAGIAGAAGLLKTVRACFERIEDPVARRGGPTLAERLMSALVMFGMKYPSLL